jgi:hypothetical protein
MNPKQQQQEIYKATRLVPDDLLNLDADDQFCRPYASEIDPIVSTINRIIERKLDDFFSEHPISDHA